MCRYSSFIWKSLRYPNIRLHLSQELFLLLLLLTIYLTLVKVYIAPYFIKERKNNKYICCIIYKITAYKYKIKTNNKKNEYVLIKTNGTILLYKSDILNVYFTQSTITFKSMPVFNLRFEFF